MYCNIRTYAIMQNIWHNAPRPQSELLANGIGEFTADRIGLQRWKANIIFKNGDVFSRWI